MILTLRFRAGPVMALALGARVGLLENQTLHKEDKIHLHSFPNSIVVKYMKNLRIVYYYYNFL